MSSCSRSMLSITALKFRATLVTVRIFMIIRYQTVSDSSKRRFRFRCAAKFEKTCLFPSTLFFGYSYWLILLQVLVGAATMKLCLDEVQRASCGFQQKVVSPKMSSLYRTMSWQVGPKFCPAVRRCYSHSRREL